MKSDPHVCIAYIVGRLIAGKSIVTLYDYSRSKEIRIESLPEADRLREFNYVNWSYMVNPAAITRFNYACTGGESLEIRIKGNTFIGYIRETSAHFLGNVRGDSIYLYDQKAEAHFNYRITGSEVKQQ